MMSKQFKGWTIPGPEVPGALRTELGTLDGEIESLDALSGHFKLFQLKKGHRFSTDDLLVTHYGTQAAPWAARVLDLGSGIGTVAITAAWRLPHARFVTVEAQEISVALARRSVAYNGLASRFDVRLGDFRDALSGAEKFDLVLGSPPYFPLDADLHENHPQKVACRFEVRGDIGDYARAAAGQLAPAGIFSCVFPIDPHAQRERVEAAARSAGLVIVRWRGVVLKEPNTPLLGIFAMMRPEDLPESARHEAWREPDLVIRDVSGGITPEYRSVKLSLGFPP